MIAWIDPKWIVNSLDVPFSQLALFPIGTILVFYLFGKLRLNANATLLDKQKPQFIITKFTFGFVSGGLILIALIAFFQSKFGVSISPLPQYLGIDNLF